MSNHLRDQRSPYLLQHAENPVDWYPWGEEAFQKAKREDKPIFLSIGYSTCHWCHVMAEESFENEAVAAILNRDFVAVKVDREERPDVDAVYMEVCTALNGSGGWPLTILMTPEQKPFFAGTYLPRENRGQYMGLRPLLQAVAAKWKNDRASFLKTGEELTAYLRQESGGEAAPADQELLNKAVRQLFASYDPEYGGFGTAPKFPTAHHLLFLLRTAKLSGSKKARQLVEHTLQQMYRGGIYDHLGGGFARYSTLKRRCTITRSWPCATPRPGRRGICRSTVRWPRPRWITACGSCGRRPAASTAARTPTARARRGSTISSRPTR